MQLKLNPYLLSLVKIVVVVVVMPCCGCAAGCRCYCIQPFPAFLCLDSHTAYAFATSSSALTIYNYSCYRFSALASFFVFPFLMVPPSLLFLLVMSSMLAPGHRSRRPWWVQYTERAIQLINIDIVTINLLCCRDAVAFLVSWCILLLDLVGGGIVSSSRGRRRRR